MNKILEQSLLYDFYGELLNEHRRRIYEASMFEDLSLGEIAESEGISRQAVHDVLKKCEKALDEYESKLHLVERFLKIKGEVVRFSLFLNVKVKVWFLSVSFGSKISPPRTTYMPSVEPSVV